jgi:hypothetical protein
MAVSIKTTGIVYPNAIASLSLPFRNGLTDEFIFGGDAAASVLNRANPARPLAQIREPVLGQGYARVGTPDGNPGPGAYNTGVTDFTADMTIIAVFRQSLAASTGPILFSETGPYTGIAADSGRIAAYNSQNATVTALADLPYPGASKFVMHAALLPNAQKATLLRYAGDALESNVAEENGAGARPTGRMMIGYPGAGSVGQCDVAYIARFNRVLSLEEIEKVHVSLEPYLAKRGVSLV